MISLKELWVITAYLAVAGLLTPLWIGWVVTEPNIGPREAIIGALDIMSVAVFATIYVKWIRSDFQRGGND